MRRIRSGNTTPELAVRKILTKAGVRYRLHRKDLPGRPDIAISRIRQAIFVHGCFWHRHQYCPRAFTPRTRQQFWVNKFRANVERDALSVQRLELMLWKVEIIWECEVKDAGVLTQRLKSIIQAYGELNDAH